LLWFMASGCQFQLFESTVSRKGKYWMIVDYCTNINII